MNDTLTLPTKHQRRCLCLTASLLALLLALPSALWATGGGGAAPGIFSPNIQQITATPTDNTLVVTALISPLSAVSEAQIEYGLTTAYGGTQWSRTGLLETSAINVPTNLGDQVGGYRISFTITGLQPGQTYHYRIFASNVLYFGSYTDPNGVRQPYGGAAYSLDALATTTGSGSPRSFEAWRQLAFTPTELADESISGPNATPQGLSSCNLLRFYFGCPPVATSGDSSSYESNFPSLRLTTTGDLTQTSLVFTRISAATDVTLAIETSTDLVTWSPSVLPTLITSSTTGNLETIEAALITKPTADYTKAFYRVKVALIPPTPGIRR